MGAWWSGSVTTFLHTPPAQLCAALSHKVVQNRFQGEPQQARAWEAQIALLRDILPTIPNAQDWQVLFEFPIPPLAAGSTRFWSRPARFTFWNSRSARPVTMRPLSPRRKAMRSTCWIFMPPAGHTRSFPFWSPRMRCPAPRQRRFCFHWASQKFSALMRPG